MAAFALARERAREGLATLPKAGGASNKTNQELGHFIKHDNLIKQNLDEKVTSRASQECFIDKSSLWLPLSCLPVGI